MEETILEFGSPEMDHDRRSTTIEDNEIWVQRRVKLKALKTVNKPHRQATSKVRVDLLLRATIKAGDVDEFIAALKRYSDEESVSLSDIIDMQGPSGSSLLHVAAGIEKADILQALLEVIDDKQLATKVNNRGDTALHIAARAGRIHAAKLLVDVDTIVDLANDTGNTALHEAVKNGHYKLTELLLNRGSRSVYPENKESKSPLYLAVETGNLEILNLLMKAMDENGIPWSRMQGMSPVHGAVLHQSSGRDSCHGWPCLLQLGNLLGNECLHALKPYPLSKDVAMLEEMSNQKKELFDLRDARGGTPLHLAASLDYVEGVKFLIDRFASSAFERDTEGYLPIHVACRRGHLRTIKELLRHWPHPEEMLTYEEGQNILHVAAKYGRASVVKYILGKPEHHEKLINAKDKEGHTPLHVATLHWQPEVLLSLTRHNKVDLKLVNNRNLTAVDIVDEQLKEIDAPLRKNLTRVILESAKVPRSKDKAICQPKGLSPGIDPEPPRLDRLKDTAGTRMIVATLIAAMTFAAGLSVPGGYNAAEPDAGLATLLNKPMYDVFVICNAIAMYSSIIVVVILFWTQINDLNAVHRALRIARLPLFIALATMSMAFMAGVHVTISKRTWITVVVLIIGIIDVFVILGLYIALFVPLWYNCRLLQLFADYIIKAAIWISRSETGGRAIRAACFRKHEDGPCQPHGEILELAPAPESIICQAHSEILCLAPAPEQIICQAAEPIICQAPSEIRRLSPAPEPIICHAENSSLEMSDDNSS